MDDIIPTKLFVVVVAVVVVYSISIGWLLERMSSEQYFT